MFRFLILNSKLAVFEWVSGKIGSMVGWKIREDSQG
jgi:hypothetical protein